MPVLTKEAILENLLKRFKGEVVYTYVGDIIVSLNVPPQGLEPWSPPPLL